MEYETAVRLRDAGFPQKEFSLALPYSGKWPSDIPLSKWPYNPPLSKLIEECGEQFCELIQTTNFTEWKARGDENWIQNLPSYNLQEGVGPTPEIAVANLWLTLKEKGII